jgi:hypothetical protein
MRIARWSVSLVAVVGVVAITTAAAFVWLLVSDPVTGAQAIEKASDGNLGPLMQAIGAVILGAVKSLFRYL